MTIDLDALDASIAEGEKKNFFVAPIVKDLIAELREARGERAAVVAWLRGLRAIGQGRELYLVLRWAEAIERGEHRREDEP
jgi:hypothetical protein